MITEWFLDLAMGFMEWFYDLWPTWEAPAWLTSLDDWFNSMVHLYGGLGVWVPFTLVFSCVGVAFTVWAIGLTIKLIRAIAAHIPMFGGAG